LREKASGRKKRSGYPCGATQKPRYDLPVRPKSLSFAVTMMHPLVSAIAAMICRGHCAGGRASCLWACPECPNGLDKELSDIIKKKGSAVVVRSSRVGEGRIVRGNNWYEPGRVAADNLSPQRRRSCSPSR
jgi:hypothetical protein